MVLSNLKCPIKENTTKKSGAASLYHSLARTLLDGTGGNLGIVIMHHLILVHVTDNLCEYADGLLVIGNY